MTEGKCHKCGKHSATVKMVRIVDGEAHTLYLCRDCASELSPFQQQGFSLQEAIEKVLEQLVQKQGGVDEASEEEGSGPRCSACGTTIGTYRKSFLLGCPQCYTAFGAVLDPQLRKLHGSTHHVGRAPEMTRHPARTADPSIADLKKELAQAVSNEDFEKAAKIRDRIRVLQSGSDHVYPEMPKM